MTGISQIAVPVAWLVMPLLVAVILYDLRLMRIPNVLVGLFLVVAGVTLALTEPLPEILWRMLAASVVFAAGLALFAARLMGGGDVKLMAALTLLIPTSTLPVFGLLFSVGIVLGVVMLMVLRALTDRTRTRWRSLRDHSRYPLGLSIGMAGLAFVAFGESIAQAFAT
ncbi:Type IV leader peptidase family protein [Sulfitobacter sp. THAF37]|uniref:A24 family peptidase n=1 Tax=Sulfitobacter sp. THAF37 TaxID=2587855 RepID=UPI001267B8E2|nr:prepilin peptidase [Sulfitobacter sp. THAF37]QFT58095.1 Type IV leader peptidase family protein [Sulfitobacter sp. THAF37]